MENNGEGNNDDCNEETIDIFTLFSKYKKRISRIFRDIDEERTVEQFLQNLKQKGSIAGYTAEFQQYANCTEWGD